MRKSSSKKWFLCLLLSFILPLQSGQASLTAKQEAEGFLRQIPSTPLAGLNDRVYGRAPQPPQFAQLRGQEDRLGASEYEDEAFPYEIFLGPSNQQISSSQSPSYAAQHHVHPQHGLKRFAIFAHCVIRAFYIVRFEANNNPDDPLDPGVPPDPLCPQSERAYLKQAERFSDWFFHLSA